MQQPTQRIRVAVHGDDLLSAAGVAAALRGQETFKVVPVSENPAGEVAVLVGWRVDDRLLARSRRLTGVQGARVVLVVGRMRESDVRKVIESGAGAVLWRQEVSGPRLAAAIWAAHQGKDVLPTDLLAQVISQAGLSRRERGDLGARVDDRGLSEREVEVLRLIADGLDTKEIARRISYSERTVKYVLHGAMTRHQLRTRAHAVAFAAREGYL